MKTPRPEELFAEVMQQDRGSLTEKDLRLLVSGLTALRVQQEKPINKIELMAVNAMIAYAAYQHHTSEDVVRALLLSTFPAAEICQLPALCYQQIIAFLADLEIPKVLN